MGVDETGAVEVRIDAAGRLTDVEIHREWSRRLGAERIGQAVVAAAADAVTKRATAWADAANRPVEQPHPDSRDSPSVPRPMPAGSQGRAENRGAALHDLMAMVRGAVAEIDVLTERLEALTQRSITGQSASGRVTATITGSQIVGVEIQTRWLRLDPTGREIAIEIESACGHAYEVEAELAADAAAQAPQVAAMRALARDPQEFVRRLGLG